MLCLSFMIRFLQLLLLRLLLLLLLRLLLPLLLLLLLLQLLPLLLLTKCTWRDFCSLPLPFFPPWLPLLVLLLMLSLCRAVFPLPLSLHKKRGKRNAEIKLGRTLAAAQGCDSGAGGGCRSLGGLHEVAGCLCLALLWCHHSLLFLLFDNYRTAHKSTYGSGQCK